MLCQSGCGHRYFLHGQAHDVRPRRPAGHYSAHGPHFDSRGRCRGRGAVLAKLGEDSRHTSSAPSAQSAESDRKSVLLMLLPGAYMQPEAFSGVLTRLQMEVAGKLQLWTATAYPIWQEVDMQAPDAMQQATARVSACVEVLLEQSQSQGFPAETLPSGRCSNLVVMAHSSASLFGAPLAAAKAGALVFLGSYFFPSPDYHASLYEWSRPVMHMGGELDGQARFARMAFPAMEAAACADHFGRRYATRNQPVILLPGVNHSHLSNGEVREGSGDLSAVASLAEANEAAGGAIADFLVANFCPVRSEQDAALVRLQQECTRTAEWLAPYTRALGLGCPHKVWDPGAAYIHGQRVAQWRNAKVDRPVPALHAPVDSPIYHAHGAEIFPDSDTTRRFCAHPGELGAARAFCAAVQERLLRSVCNLGARLPAYIRIAASVHTDIDMFTFSQPALEEGDGELLVHAHCYLHRPNLVPFGHRLPYAPHYFLKLKSAEALIQALDSYVPGAAVGQSGAATVTAQALNEETHEQAMFMVDGASLLHYRDRGKQLVASPDRDVSKEVSTPVEWVKELQIEFLDGSNQQTQVTSPIIKAPLAAGQPAAAARFSGNLYLKCLSLASAIEWILCDSLR
ncbi:hypothetical protein CVIRNUC_008426 [Coccomyxa viridis]|uniref:Uncharacterized protein n=1 Tax=Coccomyxa viridis TaxID=1274662 RepID=A0AAV1IG57_9CHLO|nr:hypothetical protein CVIRNUC_008426 [Coccomyxa viridis]